MAFQYDFVGGPIPVNQNWLRCPKCITPLTYQRKMLIIPPDPPPLLNTRPEPYVVDETNWLTTGDDFDGDTLVSGATSATGDSFITSQPNPADNANTAVIVLTATLSYVGSLTVAYLDLFNGDPSSGGASILATITGSATRTNVFASLTANGANVLENPQVITVAAAADSPSNVTHIGIYSAASAGTLLVSGPVAATAPTIVQDTAVQFNALGLQIAQVVS